MQTTFNPLLEMEEDSEVLARIGQEVRLAKAEYYRRLERIKTAEKSLYIVKSKKV